MSLTAGKEKLGMRNKFCGTAITLSVAKVRSVFGNGVVNIKQNGVSMSIRTIITVIGIFLAPKKCLMALIVAGDKN